MKISPTSTAESGRTVIFTADDFGLSPALNGAVALAHRHGLLRCASLMAVGPQVEAAFRQARELPNLCLGVHLTLIQGRAVLPPEKIPHLVDNQGRFLHHPVATGWRYFWEPRLLPEIKREMAAQIETVLRADLTPWHLNGHLNLHLHPKIFPLVLDLAREYGIPAVRLAREDWRATLALAPDHPLPKVAQGLIFALLCRRARRQAQAAGLLCNDHLFGLLNDGRMTEDYLLGLIPRPRARGHRDLLPSRDVCRRGAETVGSGVPAAKRTGGPAQPPPQVRPGGRRGEAERLPGALPACAGLNLNSQSRLNPLFKGSFKDFRFLWISSLPTSMSLMGTNR